MATSNTSTHGFPHTISRLHVVSRQYLQYSLCALKLNIVEHIIYIVVYSAPHVAITFIQMLACITIGIQSFTFNQFIFRQYTHTHTQWGFGRCAFISEYNGMVIRCFSSRNGHTFFIYLSQKSEAKKKSKAFSCLLSGAQRNRCDFAKRMLLFECIC